jgi:hypothetical protein
MGLIAPPAPAIGARERQACQEGRLEANLILQLKTASDLGGKLGVGERAHD